jgi:Flp pilus assembly protein TadB
VTALAVAAGGLGGLGLFWLAWEAFARTPAVRPAMRRLHPAETGTGPGGLASARWPAWAARRLWRPPARELALLGRTRRQYLTSLGLSALIGAGAVVVLSAALAAASLTAPLAVPAGVMLTVAAISAWSAHREVVRRAARARYEFRRAVCSYLDMCALELAAGHGPVAALERACDGVDGWVFARLRQTLLAAQLGLHQPWDDLRAVATSIDVPELGDVGNIVAAAGADGAVVHETLLARAESLRDQIRVEALARAKSTTAQLDIPGAVLLMLIATFALYPLIARFAT